MSTGKLASEVDPDDLAKFWSLLLTQGSRFYDFQTLVRAVEDTKLRTGMPSRAFVMAALGTLSGRGLLWTLDLPTGYVGVNIRHGLVPGAETLTPEEVALGWPVDRVTLARFPMLASWDATVAAYFRLAVKSHEGEVPEGALFFLGGAAERLIDVALDTLAGKTTTEKLKKAQKAKQRITLLFEIVKSAGLPGIHQDDIEWLETELTGTRLGRNDVGHPKDNPPRVARAWVAAKLISFPDLVVRLDATVTALK